MINEMINLRIDDKINRSDLLFVISEILGSVGITQWHVVFGPSSTPSHVTNLVHVKEILQDENNVSFIKKKKRMGVILPQTQWWDETTGRYTQRGKCTLLDKMLDQQEWEYHGGKDHQATRIQRDWDGVSWSMWSWYQNNPTLNNNQHFESRGLFIHCHSHSFSVSQLYHTLSPGILLGLV